MKSYPNTYYFGYATEQTKQIGKYHYPKLSMAAPIKLTSLLMGRYDIEKTPPFPGWGEGLLTNEQWYANDGLVPVMSQLYPFINEKIQHKTEFNPGEWYYENTTKGTGTSFDHLDIVCGTYLQPSTVPAQKKFYADLWKRLLSL